MRLNGCQLWKIVVALPYLYQDTDFFIEMNSIYMNNRLRINFTYEKYLNLNVILKYITYK